MQAGARLDERDIFALTLTELSGLAKLASADELFSWRSPSARPYRERRGQIGDAELLRLMAEEPRLVRRPITVSGGRVAFGAHLEALQELLRGQVAG